MEAMLGISLYSYSYLSLQKLFVFPFSFYVYSSTKLEKRGEQFLPKSEGGGGEREGVGGRLEKWPKQSRHT
jgi:hypothetical protein